MILLYCRGSVVRVLLFNTTGKRNTKVLMEPLLVSSPILLTIDAHY